MDVRIRKVGRYLEGKVEERRERDRKYRERQRQRELR